MKRKISMKRSHIAVVLSLVCLAAAASLAAAVIPGCAKREPPKPIETAQLWPEIEPFKTGYLRVSDIHEIYYELCGNPNGKPVFVLHGGPGAGSSSSSRRFFNPERFLIVLHDQRGSGRSRPFADTRQNTTWDLVADIDSLRRHLKLDKVILFGGSWGTTLGLAYAETHPENVSAIVLRGLFTGTLEEIDFVYQSGSAFFPEAYERLVSEVPQIDGRPLRERLSELVQSRDSTLSRHYRELWTHYESRISELQTTDAQVDTFLNTEHGMRLSESMGLLENYYMANRCFLKEGQLLKNADKIKDIPVVIVNGRYDMLCPPKFAYRLHKLLPKSQLVIAEKAGHSGTEPPIREALLKAMRELE